MKASKLLSKVQDWIKAFPLKSPPIIKLQLYSTIEEIPKSVKVLSFRVAGNEVSPIVNLTVYCIKVSNFEASSIIYFILDVFERQRSMVSPLRHDLNTE